MICSRFSQPDATSQTSAQLLPWISQPDGDLELFPAPDQTTRIYSYIPVNHCIGRFLNCLPQNRRKQQHTILSGKLPALSDATDRIPTTITLAVSIIGKGVIINHSLPFLTTIGPKKNTKSLLFAYVFVCPVKITTFYCSYCFFVYICIFHNI